VVWSLAALVPVCMHLRTLRCSVQRQCREASWLQQTACTVQQGRTDEDEVVLEREEEAGVELVERGQACGAAAATEDGLIGGKEGLDLHLTKKPAQHDSCCTLQEATVFVHAESRW
jgi:hypothetical protein